MRKWLLVGALAVGLLAPLAALAQPITQNTLTGRECWSAGQGPGGQSNYICADVVRSGHGIAATTITGNHTIGTTTNGNTAAIAKGGALMITAQPSAATITLPPNPLPDGALIRVCNPTAAPFATNVVTLAPNTGQTLTGGNITLTTLGAITCVWVTFNRATTTWYRGR